MNTRTQLQRFSSMTEYLSWGKTSQDVLLSAAQRTTLQPPP